MLITPISKDWQTDLASIHFYDGKIDGLCGDKTRAAIAKCKELQADLRECGFYHGDIDGWPGNQTLAGMAACRDWQAWLNAHDFDCGKVDGWPGNKTKATLEEFQRAAGCKDIDHIVGPETIAARRNYRRPAPAPTPLPIPGGGYEIIQGLINNANRPRIHIDPRGLVIHATATPGATDEAEHDYFAIAYRAASAHDFIDWDSIIEIIPDNEMAYHAGPYANAHFLSIEMCEPALNDPDAPRKFQEVWNRTVWRAAIWCKKFGWGIDELYTHHMISDTYHQTTHTDPDAFFARFGKNFDMFRTDVAAQLI